MLYLSSATGIATTGNDAAIATIGDESNIFTSGANAGIRTEGANANIVTESSTAAVKSTNFQSYTSAGSSLKNTGGTACLSWGAGSGQNLTIPAGTGVAINATTYTYGTGAAAAHRTALGLGTLATQSGTFSGTSSGTNTGDQTTIVGITGTTAQFNTALTDGDFATLAGSETLTNKTLTSPTLSGVTITGTSIVLTAGTDPAVVAVGTPTTTGAFVGGYYTAAGNSSTIYFGQNSYFNGSAFVQPNVSAVSSTLLMQANNFSFYTQAAGNATNSLGVIRARVTSTGMAIGTAAPNAKASLDVQSTTQGFLPPRMTTTQRDAITSVPAGLMIYNTTTNKINFYNGSAWEAVTSA